MLVVIEDLKDCGGWKYINISVIVRQLQSIYSEFTFLQKLKL